MSLMTQAEYARHRGIDRALITRWKKEGRLSGCFRRKTGGKQLFIISTVADKKLKDLVEPRTDSVDPGGEGDTAKGGSFVEAKTWKARYQAADIKLEYEIKQGKWILKSVVKDGVFKSGRVFRDGLMNMIPGLSPLLAVEKDEFKIAEVLKARYDELLKDLMRMLSAVGK